MARPWPGHGQVKAKASPSLMGFDTIEIDLAFKMKFQTIDFDSGPTCFGFLSHFILGF